MTRSDTVRVYATVNVMHFRQGETYDDVPNTRQIQGLIRSGMLTRLPKRRRG